MADFFDFRFFMVFEQYFDDVEADAPLRSFPPQKGARRGDQFPLLFLCDGRGGARLAGVRVSYPARFDFDEYGGVFLPCNKIGFRPGGDVIAFQNPVSSAAKILCRLSLSVVARDPFRRQKLKNFHLRVRISENSCDRSAQVRRF